MIHLLICVSISAEVRIESYVGESLESSVLGFTLFDEKQNMYLETEQPYHQIFFYLADTLILYYPEEKKAMFFSNYNPMNFLINRVAITNKGNFDISKYGFRFLLKEQIGDTLLEHWLFEKEKVFSKTYLKMKFHKGKLIEILLESKKGEILHKTEYDKYINVGGHINIPSVVSSYSYISDPVSKELLELSDIKFIESFPDSLKNIKLPSNIEIRKW
jgi:hypothetical protein